MSTPIDHLIDRIASDPRCEIEWRDPAIPMLPPGHQVFGTSAGPNPPKLGVILPPDMLRFRDRVSKVNLFAKTVKNGSLVQPNGWALWHVAFWGAETLTENLYGYEPGSIWDQLSQCYHIGTSALDGANMLGVDLRPERYGYIVECYVDQMVEGGNVPVIAHSFSEWLERTLDAGPDIVSGYWEEPGFTDYGSALDGDPCYESRPGSPRGATAELAEFRKKMGKH